MFVSLCRVCVTLSCCWKSLQVWFRWNTVTRCCWCPRSKDPCCSALKKRRSSSWAPNLARGECVCRMSCMICVSVLTHAAHLCCSEAWFVPLECLSVFYSLWNVDFCCPLVVCTAVAGLERASCQVFANRATSRCLLPDLVSDCGDLTSKDRWKTPIC